MCHCAVTTRLKLLNNLRDPSSGTHIDKTLSVTARVEMQGGFTQKIIWLSSSEKVLALLPGHLIECFLKNNLQV